MTTDGEALRLAYMAQRTRPRRMLFLCDVSGSMERYSRVLLGSLKAIVTANSKAEAFVFATQLTRLTKSLDGRDLEKALEQARGSVADWSGGTRIGKALEEFNHSYGRRGFARGAIVIVVSDGWDRGDPAVLAAEVRRIQLQAWRLVWINPRPMLVDQQPLAIGMRAAMPYIDDFVPGHDPRAIAGLAPLVGGLAKQRPRRKMILEEELKVPPAADARRPGGSEGTATAGQCLAERGQLLAEPPPWLSLLRVIRPRTTGSANCGPGNGTSGHTGARRPGLPGLLGAGVSGIPGCRGVSHPGGAGVSGIPGVPGCLGCRGVWHPGAGRTRAPCRGCRGGCRGAGVSGIPVPDVPGLRRRCRGVWHPGAPDVTRAPCRGA